MHYLLKRIPLISPIPLLFLYVWHGLSRQQERSFRGGGALRYGPLDIWAVTISLPADMLGLIIPSPQRTLFGILMHHLEWKITSLMGEVLTATAGSAAEWLHMACWRAMTLGGSSKEWGHWAAANFVNAPWETSSGFLDGLFANLPCLKYEILVLAKLKCSSSQTTQFPKLSF